MKTTISSKLALTLCCVALASCVDLSQQKHKDTPGNLDHPPGGSRYLQPDNGTPPPGPQDNQDVPPPVDPSTQPPPQVTPPDNTTPPVVTPPPPVPPVTPPATIQTPYGKPVPGKKGFVYSPFDEKAGMIDVRDYAPGTKVRDPYTNKIFLVP